MESLARKRPRQNVSESYSTRFRPSLEVRKPSLRVYSQSEGVANIMVRQDFRMIRLLGCTHVVSTRSPVVSF